MCLVQADVQLTAHRTARRRGGLPKGLRGQQLDAAEPARRLADQADAQGGLPCGQLVLGGGADLRTTGGHVHTVSGTDRPRAVGRGEHGPEHSTVLENDPLQ